MIKFQPSCLTYVIIDSDDIIESGFYCRFTSINSYLVHLYSITYPMKISRQTRQKLKPATLLEDGSLCIRGQFSKFGIDDETSMHLYGMPLPDEVEIRLAPHTQNKMLHHAQLLKEHRLMSLRFIDSTRHEPKNSFVFFKQGKFLDMAHYEEGDYFYPVAHSIFEIDIRAYEIHSHSGGKDIEIGFIADFLLCNERCEDNSIVTDLMVLQKSY